MNSLQYISIDNFSQASYDVKVIKPETRSYLKNMLLPSNILRFKMYFSTGRHFLRREYVRYTLDSLYADIGGYMGLFVGHSILSLIVDLWRYVSAKGKLR